METVLITGANRGLGLEFARQYAEAGWEVIATCRDPADAPALNAVQGAVAVHQLDVTDLEAIDALGRRLDGVPLDVVIACAGVMGPRGPAETVSLEEWLEAFLINCIAPVRLALATRPLLKLGAQRKLIAITSKMGSIGDGPGGGFTPYRTSKAALNMAWANLAREVAGDEITACVLHPGWVRTRMGGDGAALEPSQSIAEMRALIERLTLEQSGGFFNYRGDPIPW